MLLTEYEAKKILLDAGLSIPQAQLVEAPGILTEPPVDGAVVKAQVLHGNRALSGLVVVADNKDATSQAVSDIFSKKDAYGQPVEAVLVEEKIEFGQAYYISLGYDTHTRRLVCRFSAEGGVGMDERGNTLQVQELSVLNEPKTFSFLPELLPVVQKLWLVFTTHDAVLVEINPLVHSKKGFVCLDAKIELEDAARFRHPEWKHVSRAVGEKKRTPLEQKALAISRVDHRGVAGESFFEFPGGTIGVLASGGGASALVMDGLIHAGLKPANYTEYSGNPTAQKVQNLTELVAGIEGLEALLIVGSTANFTDIYETLKGVVDGVMQSSLDNHFPIVIRRGGPRWQAAFAMIQESLPTSRFDVTLLGPDVPILDAVTVLQKVLAKKRSESKETE